MTGVFGLLAVVGLIAANGVFVAAEFALVSVSRPVVDDLAASGDRRARTVARELSDLSFALSSAQFGITVTSLLVGLIAERAIGDTLIVPVLEMIGVPASASVGVAIIAAFLLSTMTQMVVGELFPKNVAISVPLAVARAVTPATRAFGLLFGPVIRLFHNAAVAVTRHVFRVEPVDELEGGHTLDELALIISASGEDGSLTEHQADLLARALELGDTRVSEVMVPRLDVTWLAADDTLADLRSAARSTGHSRFPVRGETEDDVIGTVHVKDLLTRPRSEHAQTCVSEVVVPMFAVPASEPLRQLLADLRREQRTFALVVDEYGGTAGIVTVEDLIEELVGDIFDEFDRGDDIVRRLGAGRFLVRGTIRAEQLEALVGVELPMGDFETVAGFVLERLGRVPAPGEHVAHDGWRFEVTEVDGMRITELAVQAPAEAWS